MTTISPLLGRIPDVAADLPDAIDPTTAEAFEQALEPAQSFGRPLGHDAWPRQLEPRTAQAPRPAKPGPKPRRPQGQAGEDLFSELSP